MWRTSEGIRRLQGAEARLVRAAAAVLYEQLKNRGEPDQFGACAFDRLRLEQQMFVVLAVAQRLTDDQRPLPLDAWAEAAVFAIFECVHAEVALDIGLSEDPNETPTFRWRRLARDALVEKWGDSLAVACDEREWDFNIVSLSRHILWDLDFLKDEKCDGLICLPDHFAAQPPEWAPIRMRELPNFHKNVATEDRTAA